MGLDLAQFQKPRIVSENQKERLRCGTLDGKILIC